MESKFVLFRLENDDAIYLADLDAGTVERRESQAVDGIEFIHQGGRPALKGVEFALASSARSSAASHVYFPNR